MEFEHSDKVKPLQEKLRRFMDDHIYPNERRLDEEIEENTRRGRRWTPHEAGRGTEGEGARAGTLEPVVAEGARRRAFERRVRVAVRDHGPRVLGAGGLQLLGAGHRQHGDADPLWQRGAEEQWLEPLTEGKIRSCFAMTEPDVASSDATNIRTRIVRDGDHYVVNGRKWWSSGAMDPRCQIFIFMGKTDPDGPRHQQQSMVLIPRARRG